MAVALIALGSNLQQPEKQVSKAIKVLANTPGLRLIKASSLYATAPVGYDNQPDFINAVVQVATDIPAPQLMQLLLDIEQTFGRERPFPNAPRILDLDLLDYQGMHLDTELLKLPHPRMHERGFVIVPLAEIVPDFMLPQGKTVVEWMAESQHQDIRKIGF
ncbi:MAG TPA: 2-amino-4-hydroxy-6-hydroxymethyldihydropteridine diphosphokinase [Methylophilus sp.]|nr:2-amino-4-hydroxy-6-hydroxymethyldihydropteridine diphosphokinase [Methylophilus sp.]